MSGIYNALKSAVLSPLNTTKIYVDVSPAPRNWQRQYARQNLHANRNRIDWQWRQAPKSQQARRVQQDPPDRLVDQQFQQGRHDARQFQERHQPRPAWIES